MFIDAFSHEGEEFDGFSDALRSYHLKSIFHSCLQQGRGDFPLGCCIGTREMSLEQVVDMGESAVPETVLLLLVPAVEDGAEQVICLLAFHHIV